MWNKWGGGEILVGGISGDLPEDKPGFPAPGSDSMKLKAINS